MADKKKPDFEDLMIVLLFIAGFVLRVQMLGIIDYPGNLKAADAVNHQMIAQGIAESEQYKYMPIEYSFGHEKVVNYLPPLYYISLASLTKISGLSTWNLSVVMGMLFNSLWILVIYLIANSVFKKKEIALIAGSLFVLPLNIDIWTYYSYIGMHVQAAGNALFGFSLYLVIEYLQKPKTWKLLLLALSSLGIYLVHFSELFPLLALLAVVLIKYLKTAKKDFRLVAGSFALLLIPAFLYLPRMIGWFSNRASSVTSLVRFQIPEVTDRMLYPGLFSIHWIILLLALAGLVQVVLNRKKYKQFLLIFGYLLVYIYLGSIISPQTYILRHKSLLPLFILPLAAYLIYYLVVENLTKVINFNKSYIAAFLSFLVVIAGVSGYLSLKERLGYRNISPERYAALKYLEDNSLPGSKVLVFSGFGQGSEAYDMRVNFNVEMSELSRIVSYIVENNETPENIRTSCSNRTSFMIHYAGETSFFTHDYYDLDCPESFTDFDFILMENMNDQIAQLNQYIYYDMLKKNFTAIYAQDNIIILKNENR